MFLEINNSKDKIKFQKVKFTCDEYICEDMKNITQWCHMSKTNFTVFLGRPGSGKTSLMMNIISCSKLYKHKFDNIMLIMPPNSRKSLEKELLIDEKKTYDDLNDNSIDIILQTIETNSKNNETTLLILDDVASALKSSVVIQQKLAYIVYNMRHLKCSIFMLVQSYITIPKNIRKNISNLVIFKLSKAEMTVIGEEILELQPKNIINLISLYKEKYDYLFIHLSDQSIYKNQNVIKFVE